MTCLASHLLTVLSCWSYPISSIARMLMMWIPFSSAGRQEYVLFTLISVSSGASLRSSGRKSTPQNSLSASEKKRHSFIMTLLIPTLAPPRATQKVKRILFLPSSANEPLCRAPTPSPCLLHSPL